MQKRKKNLRSLKRKVPTLSAYILTYNNADTIGRCIDSLKGIEEILIIDSGSTDKTLEICKKNKNVKIYSNEWAGFPKQRNFAMSKIKTDWFLWVDSDMEATPELIEEIKKTIKNPTHDAYMISYYNTFMDTFPLLGGEWFPSYQPMLHKNLPDLKYDERRVVHEGCPYDGEYGYLKNFIIHHSYPTINLWITKMAKYTDLEVVRYSKGVKIFGRFKANPNPMSLFSTVKFLFWYPTVYFFWVMFWKKGYKSGIPGFIYAGLSSFYLFVAHAKYWEHLMERHKLKPSMKQTVTRGYKEKKDYLTR